MTYEILVFRVHAIRRMFERSISAADVRSVLRTGETIVITAYEPDPDLWEPDFRRKRE